MSLCPKDFKPCCDDLCHGSGCLRMGGEPMLDICPACQCVIDPFDGCPCDQDPDRWEEDDWDEDDPPS